jgi:shikimate kinase
VKKNKYILIGIPNCGKSTLGKRAADILHLPFFDTDTLAVDKMSLENPTDIFRFAQGWKFLDGQREAIIKLSNLRKSAIIATGAEAALTPECAELMKKMGTVIHLQRKLELALADIQNSDKKGFVLYEKESGEEINMSAEAVRLYAKELPQYEALADVTLENNGSEDEGVDALVSLIKSMPDAR